MGSTQPNGIPKPDTALGGPDDGASDLDYVGSSIGRMTLILDAFAHGSELGQADIVRHTGLPKATVHRTVGLLVEFGWLQRLGDRLRLGTRLFEMGGRVVTTGRLREVAIPFLEDLYEACHEIVNLGVLDGTSVIYLEKLGSHRRIDTPARPGGRFPAHCTALGKVMLAFGPTAALDRVAAAPMLARTSRTITDVESLRASVARIADDGFAIDQEEFADGMVCCAAPVRGSGRAIAAVSVTGPIDRIDVDALRPHVLRAAGGIARAYLY